VGRAILLSVPFTVAMIAQQMSLTRVSPAVNAFLTSLNVLFVPIIVACLSRRLPNASLIASIALAVIGIWMLSNPGEAGFGWGEILGVACSFLFSVHILLINALLKHDTPARMVGGQFLITGAAMFGLTMLLHPAARSSNVMFATFSPQWLAGFLMLVAISTLLSFGLMLQFQPRVDPTRAALIYLTEPIFAAAYAWILAGDGLSSRQIAGAGLIIVANSLVEWLAQRRLIKTAIPVVPQA
jgi:drug/metabolite transporter (DMT)-like permease